MKRYASVIRLPEANYAAYKALHADPWPEVVAMMQACHFTNYSIFYKAEMLFSYLEYRGEDFEADCAKMAADPKTQEWWTHCTPLQRAFNAEAEEWWADMEEVFHVD